MPFEKLQNKFRCRKKSKPKSPSAFNCGSKGMNKTGKSSEATPKAKTCRTGTTDEEAMLEVVSPRQAIAMSVRKRARSQAPGVKSFARTPTRVHAYTHTRKNQKEG